MFDKELDPERKKALETVFNVLKSTRPRLSVGDINDLLIPALYEDEDDEHEHEWVSGDEPDAITLGTVVRVRPDAFLDKPGYEGWLAGETGTVVAVRYGRISVNSSNSHVESTTFTPKQLDARAS